jgi:hypothetical protein
MGSHRPHPDPPHARPSSSSRKKAVGTDSSAGASALDTSPSVFGVEEGAPPSATGMAQARLVDAASTYSHGTSDNMIRTASPGHRCYRCIALTTRLLRRARHWARPESTYSGQRTAAGHRFCRSWRSPSISIVGLGCMAHVRTRPRPLRHKRGPPRPAGQRRSRLDMHRPGEDAQTDRFLPQHSWHRRGLLKPPAATPMAEATALAGSVAWLDREESIVSASSRCGSSITL